MLILIIAIPILSALLVLIAHRRYASAVAPGGVILTLAATVYIVAQVISGHEFSMQIGGLPGLPFALKTGRFSAVLLTMVNIVATGIFIYSAGYMKDESGKKAFWSGMSLFFAGMNLLLISGDWISFIAGWEIMGFASWRLIATWHHKKSAREGATKAFMLTRVTDMGLYLGIIFIILKTGTSSIEASAHGEVPLAAAGFLLLAVMGKSAQVPFQSWLSSAMAGPTPVSAFLHSATMVAAGVILLLKSNPLLPADFLPWIALAGIITILLTGTTALLSKDVKQMLAASTSSHLGFMLLAIGAGYPGAAAAHLLAHAFMKSSLFLGSGIWQQAYGKTSFAAISNSAKKFTTSYILFAIAAIALSGIPPLIGYYSKDAVLAAGLKSDSEYWYFVAAAMGALLTAFYMGRALQLLRQPADSTPKQVVGKKIMLAGMGTIIAIVLGGGFILKPVVKFMHLKMPHSTTAIITGLIVAVAGLLTGWLVFNKAFKGKWAEFIRDNYQVAGGYHNLVVLPVMKLSEAAFKLEKVIRKIVFIIGDFFYSLSKTIFKLDEYILQLIKGIGNSNLRLSRLSRVFDESGIEETVIALADFIRGSGRQGRKLQSGMVHREMMWSMIGFTCFMIIMIFLNL